MAAYNARSIDAERFFVALKAFVDEMDDEERRAAREGLSEDELAIFDLLTRPVPKLTKAQEAEVKKVARELMAKLCELVDAIDWTKGQQTRAAVHSAIRVKLNELPEEPCPDNIWNEKTQAVWEFVLNRYSDGREARPAN